jgi:hypothetical protein
VKIPEIGNWPDRDAIQGTGRIETLFSQRWLLPGAVLAAALCRVLRLAVSGRQHHSLGARLVGWAMLPLILLSLPGLWLYRRSPLAWMTTGALLLVMVSSGLTTGKPRFRFPCDPLLIIFSVAALQSTISARTHKARQTEPAGLSTT